MLNPDRTAIDAYRQSLTHVRTLDPDVERQLARAWRDGDRRAGEVLIESSLPFVIRIAKEYRRWGVPLEDLIQQGNVGLLKAASKYDPDKDCRLITYAVYWIRAEIREHVVRSYRIVRLGTTRTERRAMRAYRRSAVANVEDLAASSGMPLDRAKLLWPLLSQRDSSLDQPVREGPAAVERLVAPAADPESEVARTRERAGVQAALRRAMAKLTPRERKIVRARFLAEEPSTLERLGHELGVSKERVRQLEERIRAKLRVDLAAFQPAA